MKSQIFGSIVFLVIAVPLALGKVQPNGWYGVRTRMTLGSSRFWYYCNRRFGCCLMLTSSLFLAVYGWSDVGAALQYRTPAFLGQLLFPVLLALYDHLRPPGN